MRYRLITGALLLALAAAPAEGGKNKPAPNPGVETKNTGATVPSAVVEKKVARLTDQVHWFSSLAEAKELAQKQNKPILWLHALGDLDGVC